MLCSKHCTFGFSANVEMVDVMEQRICIKFVSSSIKWLKPTKCQSKLSMSKFEARQRTSEWPEHLKDSQESVDNDKHSDQLSSHTTH